MRFGEAGLGETGPSWEAPAAILALAVLGLVAALAAVEVAIEEPGRRERAVPLELVAVSGGVAPLRRTAREVSIHVLPGGEISAHGGAITFEAFEEYLSSLGAPRLAAGGTALTVRADAKAPYGVVARILAAARKAGIRDASLVTVEK